MEETEFATKLVELAAENELSEEEWMALISNGTKLKNELPSHVDVEEVIQEAKDKKREYLLQRAIDSIQEQNWVDRQNTVTQIASQADSDSFDDLTPENLPEYLLGNPEESQEGVKMEIHRSSDNYISTVKWDSLGEICNKLINFDKSVTPYAVRDLSGLGHGKTKTVVVYLWKKGALSPTELQTKGSVSVKFEVHRENLQDVISLCKSKTSEESVISGAQDTIQGTEV